MSLFLLLRLSSTIPATALKNAVMALAHKSPSAFSLMSSTAGTANVTIVESDPLTAVSDSVRVSDALPFVGSFCRVIVDGTRASGHGLLVLCVLMKLRHGWVGKWVSR